MPLLSGAGVTFNRIAGPNAQPGFFLARGVLLARVSEDITAADFEQGVIDYINELETAYWELYFAYRNLEVIKAAKDSVTTVVAETTEAVEAGTLDGFRRLAGQIQLTALTDQYQNAMAGSPATGPGVLRGERELRWLLGLPATDGRLIRPADTPFEANIAFDWDHCRHEAVDSRVELRRQKWQIKRRELELIAAKNFILPQLDLFATNRFRGFGDRLAGGGSGRFADAWGNLGTLDYFEVEGGIEMSLPVGFRQGWAAVRHAKLSLSRERAVFDQQIERVINELSNAVAEADRATTSTQLNFERLLTAREYQESVEVAWRTERRASVESRLDAVSQIVAAETQFHRSVIDQTLAIKEIHLAKGSLLKSHSILLSESDWDGRNCSKSSGYRMAPRSKTRQIPHPLGGEDVVQIEMESDANGLTIEPELLETDTLPL